MLHQVGVSFDLYYDARKHKIKMQLSISLDSKNLAYLFLKDGLRRILRSNECKKQEFGEAFHNAQLHSLKGVAVTGITQPRSVSQT